MFMSDDLYYLLILGSKHVSGAILWIFAQRAYHSTKLVITSTHILIVGNILIFYGILSYFVQSRKK